MATKQITYISGPMTGYERFNFEAFDKASHKLKELGYKIINPAQIARDLGFDPKQLADDWNWNKLPKDISLDTIKGGIIDELRHNCNSIYMLQGWTHSTGAKAEHALAEWLGYEIIYQEPQDAEINRLYNKEWWFTFQHNTFEELKDLTKKKNNDYTGGKEHSNPFANFDEAEGFGIDPIIGLSLRIGDKMQRLRAFCNSGLSLETKGDTVADIFKDLIGYSTLALGMLERKKGKN